MWHYIFLGVIQGIFEWLPISSEGVVALLGKFLISDLNAVDLALFLHLGTLLAVLVYFRKGVKEIIFFKNPKLLKFLLIATFISLAVGFPLYKLVKNIIIGNVFLLVMGLGLLATSYFHKTKKIFKIEFKNMAGLCGVLQGLAVIPGLSRSGATIFGLSLAETDPAEVLKLSYFMSIPIVLCSSLYLFFAEPVLIFKAWPALIFSFLAGIASLSLLLKIAKKIDFFKFTLILAHFVYSAL